MAASRYLGEDMATTQTVSYKKEFAWKIENWKDWWTSMDIDEITLSKTFILEVEGISHEFKLAMLKYHSYDGIVDSIDVMLRLSLYYKGPFDSIIMKPSFYLPIIGIETGHTFEAARLKKSCYTEAWCWSHNWFNVNMDDILQDGNLTFACLARINLVKSNSNLICLQDKLSAKNTWYQGMNKTSSNSKMFVEIHVEEDTLYTIKVNAYEDGLIDCGDNWSKHITHKTSKIVGMFQFLSVLFL